MLFALQMNVIKVGSFDLINQLLNGVYIIYVFSMETLYHYDTNSLIIILVNYLNRTSNIIYNIIYI